MPFLAFDQQHRALLKTLCNAADPLGAAALHRASFGRSPKQTVADTFRCLVALERQGWVLAIQRQGRTFWKIDDTVRAALAPIFAGKSQ